MESGQSYQVDVRHTEPITVSYKDIDDALLQLREILVQHQNTLNRDWEVMSNSIFFTVVSYLQCKD